MDEIRPYPEEINYLLRVIQKLSLSRSLDEVVSITRHAARILTGSDGATFVLREGDKCYYVDEESIAPLWKGKRFPIESCVSGWAMLNKQHVVVEDIYTDSRVPVEAYEPTYVKSLLIVPIRIDRPIGAIGNYWAKKHLPTSNEIHLLEALAHSTSIALENVQLISDLHKMNISLEESIRDRDEFFSIVAHELRTPLTTIKLQLQLNDRELKKLAQDKAGAFKRDGLDLSISQVNRFSALIEQLLDVSCIMLNRVEIKAESVNLTEFIRAAALRWSSLLEASNCQLSMNLRADVVAVTDPVIFEKILNNLLSNIIKHASGSRAMVSLISQDEKALLTISDNGPGLTSEFIRKLFQRFERGGAPRYISGLGLGLYITKSFVDSLGGEVSVSSEKGQGSQFNIIIPLNNDKERTSKNP